MATTTIRPVVSAGILAAGFALLLFSMAYLVPASPADPGQPSAAPPAQTPPAEVSQVARFMDVRHVGIFAAVRKAANGASQPIYEPGIAINVCSPACDQTGTVYMWNTCPDAHKVLPDNQGKGRFARGDYIKVVVDTANKSGRITMVKSVEAYPFVAGEDHKSTYILKDAASCKGPGLAEYLRVSANKLGREYTFAIPIKLSNGRDADDNSARIVKAIQSYKPGQLMKLMPSGTFGTLPALVDVQRYGPVEKGVMAGMGKVTSGPNEYDAVIVEVNGQKKEWPIPKVLMLTDQRDQQPKAVTDPSLLAAAKAIPKGQAVEFAPFFDIFNNNFITGLQAIAAVPLAVGVGASTGGGGGDCIAYILVGTVQAYIANIASTAGTGAVGNTYTVGWVNSGSCFVVFDAVVEVH
ncbi:MAG: hypothetical protein HZA50_18575 [Planctomycetes bacterium]|nr:hypothetical protein [Planctomycetota bacterium]